MLLNHNSDPVYPAILVISKRSAFKRSLTEYCDSLGVEVYEAEDVESGFNLLDQHHESLYVIFIGLDSDCDGTGVLFCIARQYATHKEQGYLPNLCGLCVASPLGDATLKDALRNQDFRVYMQGVNLYGRVENAEFFEEAKKIVGEALGITDVNTE